VILALRWKLVDLLRSTIEIAESLSDGQFGSLKTRSSNCVMPMSPTLRGMLETYRTGALRNSPGDLKSWTRTQMSPGGSTNAVAFSYEG
jgi:hypothetical protein